MLSYRVMVVRGVDKTLALKFWVLALGIEDYFRKKKKYSFLGDPPSLWSSHNTLTFFSTYKKEPTDIKFLCCFVTVYISILILLCGRKGMEICLTFMDSDYLAFI